MTAKREAESGTVTPVYRCDACGKEFRTPEALYDHVNSAGLVY